MILDWAETHLVQILTRFVRGSDNMAADCLSRRHQVVSTVDTTHGRVPPDVVGMGLPDTGSLCHSPEQQDPELCVSISGSRSDCHKCLPLQLGLPGSVCLPSTSSYQESDQQALGLQEHETHSDSSILATEGVVSRPVAGIDGATPTPSVAKRSPEATTHPQVPLQSPRASADRVETV